MSVHQTSAAADAPPRMYSETLTPSLQRLLAALADIDFRHDRDLDRLQRTSLPEQTRLQIAQEMGERHRLDREPYVRRITELSNLGRQAA